MEIKQFNVRTDKHTIGSLPRYLYEGPVTVVDGEKEAERCVEILRRSGLLGLDTETRPSFKRGDRHVVALLQVASHEACFLFRLNHIGLPQCLCSLLEDPDVPKVGLSLQDDFPRLRVRRDFKPAGYVELQTLVSQMGIEDLSLQKLYANVFHQRLSKGARLSNWEADSLTETQIRYAATDAVACINLYDALAPLAASGQFTLIDTPPAQPNT